jgi:hypothetical protein
MVSAERLFAGKVVINTVRLRRKKTIKRFINKILIFEDCDIVRGKESFY